MLGFIKESKSPIISPLICVIKKDKKTKTATGDLPSSQIDPSKLAHLSQKLRQELLAVLDKYPECFSETPGRCNTVEYEIIVTRIFGQKK